MAPDPSAEVPAEPPAEPPSAGSSRAPYYWALGIGALALLCLLLPGDIPWINDEPRLFLNAMEANAEGRLAARGLMGTVGIHYGPLPTWYYQGALHLTSDPVKIAVVKNVIGIGLLIAAMLMLARELGWTRWALLLCLASPYIWFLNRMLWDNCFLIPLSALLLACWLRFHRTARLGWMLLGAAISVVFVHTQIKTAFTILAFYACLALFDWRELRRRWRVVLPAALLVLGLCLPYFIYAARHLAPGTEQRASRWAGLLGALTGGRYWSFVGWPEYYLPEMYSANFPLPKLLTGALIALTALALVFCAAGFGQRLWLLARHLRARRALDVHDRATVFCLIVVVVAGAFYVLTGQRVHPHYHFGTWSAYAFFSWSAVDWLARRRWGWGLLLAQGAPCVLLLGLLIGFVHVNGGGRGIHYGATLANQMACVRQVREYPGPKAVDLGGVAQYRLFPQAWHALDQLARRRLPPVPEDRAPPMLLRLEYAAPDDPADGRLAVRAYPPPPALLERLRRSAQQEPGGEDDHQDQQQDDADARGDQ